MGKKTLVSVFVVLVAAGAAGKALAAPANDNFVNAQGLVGSQGDLNATNKDATKEVGEPAHAGNAGGASIWFKWTADRNVGFTVLTRQVQIDTILGVYTGATVDTLTEVASNDDVVGGTTKASRVSFIASAGTTYYIAVDGFNGAQGPFAVRWREGPENDLFSEAAPLASPLVDTSGTTFGATSETGEPLHGQGATVWYTWTAPADGEFTFLERAGLPLTVYTGASVNALTEVATGSIAVKISATQSTEYRLAVEGPWSGAFFDISWNEAPPNDDFADAQVVTGKSGSVETGSNKYATRELTESAGMSGASGQASLWYRWTAPATGRFRFQTITKFDGVLDVFTGTTVDALTPVAGSDDFFGLGLAQKLESAVSFRATVGTTYSIRVASFGGGRGITKLRWFPGAIIIRSGTGDDVINGTSGRDYIDAGRGNDTIHGRGRADIIVGGSGHDQLYGDEGGDQLISRDFVRHNDVIHGGPGTDTVIKDRGDTVFEVP